MSTVSIIFPFYNQAEFLQHTLPSLKLLNEDIPICFIDNGSTDGSADLVREFGRGTLLTNEGQRTLGGLWNQGLRELHTPYVLLLRSTTKITQESLDLLVAEIESDSKIASVAPMLLTSSGLVQNSGVVYIRGIPTPADMLTLPDNERASSRKEFKSLRDNCLLIRRHGLFKETYHAENQDYDWTLTAYLDGYKNVYTPFAQATTLELAPVQYNKNPTDYSKMVSHFGGLQEMDKFNDGGTYYDGPEGMRDLPSTEVWNYNKGQSKGKIMVFLADHDGCGTYRLKNPYRGMILRGWDVAFTTYAPDDFIRWGDIVVVQRACENHMIDIVRKAHAWGKKVIFEIDDFFHGLELSNPVVESFSANPHWLRNMERIIYMSDALTVSTPELAKQYGRFNSYTTVIPNCIDLGLIPQPIKENHDGTVRIGWGGSGTHDGDMKLVVSAIERVLTERPQTRLVFLGSDYRHFFKNADPSQMEWLPATWGHEDVVADYYKLINDAKLDIGLAPIADNIFNRAKSDLKLIEYGVFGIVPIASDVEPYHNFLTKTDMGFLARNETDWYKYLVRLVDSPSLRTQMGRNIQQHSLNYRGVGVMVDQVEQVVESVLAGKGHKPIKAEPVHSLNVPYLRNLTAKKATELMQQMKAGK